MRGALALVTGGARCGKSAFAERLAQGRGGPVLYVATGQPSDAEMAARIAAHRARRPAGWVTLEEPLEPARAIRTWRGPERVVLLDCLGLLVSNLLLAEGSAADVVRRVARVGDELVALAREGGRDVILVSSEVGSGLVPLSALARQYCDLLGDLNQRVAQTADHVYLVVAGLAVDLHALAMSPPEQQPGS